MGVFKIYKNGKIYKCKKSHCKWNGEYRDYEPRLIIAKNNDNYVYVTFRHDGKTVGILAHRAVWIYFNGIIPKGLQINHKNGIKTDNRPSNLELVTPSQNILHGINILGSKVLHGEECGSSKLTSKEVIKIRRIFASSKSTQKTLTKQYNVSKSQINRIINRKTWQHI
ncbi:hypothetical protein LCGC14_2162270 [marine sediment metagenome]|uniref:HNH nuclease domain-containing protein n=1 Tax=marine sediment metagenome TaxID=412755 RepID=A0A0F9GNJ4_9ZZZZ